MFKKSSILILFSLFSSVSWSQETGCIEGDCRNGQGIYTYAGGNKYVGEFKNGKRHGEGAFTWAKGDKYVGEFKDGKLHGQGTYTLANGDKYVGEFKDDKPHGQGNYYSPAEWEAKEKERKKRLGDYYYQWRQ